MKRLLIPIMLLLMLFTGCLGVGNEISIPQSTIQGSVSIVL